MTMPDGKCCGNCDAFMVDRFDNGKEHVTPDGFCAWAERKDGGDD